MTVLTLYVDANARPQGHRHLLARPPGIFCSGKALGLGTHFSAKAPGCPGGGMVTGQIDTCIIILLILVGVELPLCVAVTLSWNAVLRFLESSGV